MYIEGEDLTVLEPLGKEGTSSYVPVGTIVKFVKVMSNDNDLAKSMIVLNHNDKVIVTLETNVRIKSWWRRRQAFKQFNNQMMINNPRLRRYHPNIILKVYYRLYYYIKGIFGYKQ